MEQKIKRDRNMGDNLRKLRLDHDISQEKLCAELQRHGCDIGRITYAKYEAGELNICASIIIELKKITTVHTMTFSTVLMLIPKVNGATNWRLRFCILF